MKKLLLASVALLAFTATASADIALRLCQDGCATSNRTSSARD